MAGWMDGRLVACILRTHNTTTLYYNGWRKPLPGISIRTLYVLSYFRMERRKEGRKARVGCDMLVMGQQLAGVECIGCGGLVIYPLGCMVGCWMEWRIS